MFCLGGLCYLSNYNYTLEFVIALLKNSIFYYSLDCDKDASTADCVSDAFFFVLVVVVCLGCCFHD